MVYRMLYRCNKWVSRIEIERLTIKNAKKKLIININYQNAWASIKQSIKEYMIDFSIYSWEIRF